MGIGAQQFDQDFAKFNYQGTLSEQGVQLFRHVINEYYQQQGRYFPWRATDNPYHIVVSEIMLQQTQTERAISKYEQFILQLPSFHALADVSARDLLTLWSGLGYNRRALFLQKIAQKVVHEHAGVLPADPQLLQTFPGIGPGTAGSICAFAYNLPTVFIETNIRTVFIHTFFKHEQRVNDKALMPLIAQTVDQKNARHWYYALMDYGVMLKKKYKNPSRLSVHHTKQSTFEGSERQIRGQIIKLLTEHSALPFEYLVALTGRERARVEKNLHALCLEGLVKQTDDLYHL